MNKGDCKERAEQEQEKLDADIEDGYKEIEESRMQAAKNYTNKNARLSEQLAISQKCVQDGEAAMLATRFAPDPNAVPTSETEDAVLARAVDQGWVEIEQDVQPKLQEAGFDVWNNILRMGRDIIKSSGLGLKDAEKFVESKDLHEGTLEVVESVAENVRESVLKDTERDVTAMSRYGTAYEDLSLDKQIRIQFDYHISHMSTDWTTNVKNAISGVMVEDYGTSNRRFFEEKN